jgi:hypothetical protein
MIFGFTIGFLSAVAVTIFALFIPDIVYMIRYNRIQRDRDAEEIIRRLTKS